MKKINAALAMATLICGLVAILTGLFYAPAWAQTIAFGFALLTIAHKFACNAKH